MFEAGRPACTKPEGESGLALFNQFGDITSLQIQLAW